MPFWTVAQLDSHHVPLALYCLEKVEGYTVYAPRLRQTRIIRRRERVSTPLLFPAYAFVLIGAAMVEGPLQPRRDPGDP